jgi:hypothetical protein
MTRQRVISRCKTLHCALTRVKTDLPQPGEEEALKKNPTGAVRVLPNQFTYH